MNSLEFLSLEQGSIGKLSYYKKNKIKLSPENEQKKVDSFTSKHLSALIMKKSFGEDVDLSQAFASSRKDAKNDLDFATDRMMINTIHYQIGQTQSYEELLEIEQRSDFGGWLDSSIIDNIKVDHESRKTI